MSNMARSNEIDELVLSVRNLVSYKDADLTRKMPPQDRLMLVPAWRIDVPQDKISDHTAPTAAA